MPTLEITHIKYTIVCTKCNSTLFGGTEYRDLEMRVVVEPCKKCLEHSYAKGCIGRNFSDEVVRII